jgi:hypothetical protein
MRIHANAMGLAVAVLVVTAVGGAGCGKGDQAAGGGSGSAGSGSGSAIALAPPALGVDAAKRFNYEYGDGAAAFKQAQAAYKAKDWAGVEAAARKAVTADSYHMDARRLLAVALAQLGKPAEAAEHLATVLGQDYYRFHAELAADADLAAFRATPEGAALAQVDAALAQTAQQLAASGNGLPVLARRSTFKWPSKAGAQWATTRGELYLADLDSKRLIRLTHTGHAVAAVLASPSGKELAVIGYEKVEMPDPKGASFAPPLFARAWVEAYDPATWQPTTRRATITPPKGAKARGAVVAYGAGDQLLVGSVAPGTSQAAARWELGEITWSSVDRSTGKTTKTAAPAADAPRALITLDEGWVERPLAAVTATWSAPTAIAPPLASQLALAGGKTIDIPESGKTERDSLSASPGGTRIAFATWTDPCGTDAHRSLYVADVATGQVTHLLTEASRFRSRWLDDNRLAYEDAKGHIRLWTAADRRELLKLEDRAGLALAAFTARLPPLCKTAPTAVEPDTGGDTPTDPLPPETGSGSAAGSAGSAAPADGSGTAAGPATTPE